MNIRVIVDLSNRFGEIREQGTRPTCSAFAASDAHSFARGIIDPLSAEYAFYYAVQRKTNPDRTQAVSFSLISEAISVDGQPLESEWPYLMNLSVTDEWQPPRNLGTIFKWNSNTITTDIASVYESLDSNQPVILGMYITRSFLMATANVVLVSRFNEPAINTHAVIAVGYGESQGGPCLLIRNSWGQRWCNNGYAWIHETYLIPRLIVVGRMVETL